MIVVRPGSDAWRVLALVVANPGQLDARAVGVELWRPRLLRAPPHATLDELRRFTAVQRVQVERMRAEVLAHEAEWTSRASGFFRRLQERGFLERRRPPRVAEGWRRLAAENPGRAIDEARDADIPGDLPSLRIDLLADLVSRSPSSLTDWVGATPPGNVQRAVADLVEWGLVVPSSFRWPTEAGIAYIEETASLPPRRVPEETTWTPSA